MENLLSDAIEPHFRTTPMFPRVGDRIQVMGKVCEISHIKVQPEIVSFFMAVHVDGTNKPISIPFSHLNWCGNQWIVEKTPYQINIDTGGPCEDLQEYEVSEDLPEVIVPRKCALIANSPAEAIQKYKNKFPDHGDTVTVCEINKVRLQLEGERLVENLLLDLLKTKAPGPTMGSFLYSRRSTRAVRVQVAQIEGRKEVFINKVNEAWKELTQGFRGHGVWWHQEGHSTLYCTECGCQLVQCQCPNY